MSASTTPEVPENDLAAPIEDQPKKPKVPQLLLLVGLALAVILFLFALFFLIKASNERDGLSSELSETHILLGAKTDTNKALQDQLAVAKDDLTLTKKEVVALKLDLQNLRNKDLAPSGATPDQVKQIVSAAMKSCRTNVASSAPSAKPLPLPVPSGQGMSRPAVQAEGNTSAVSGGDHFLWHHFKATPSAPAPCVVSGGGGIGLPPYCSTYKVVPTVSGETKAAWLVRVGDSTNPGDTGSYNKGLDKR